MIKNSLKQLLQKEITRFVIVGIIATVIHYSIYLLLRTFIYVNISYTIGYVTSLVCNFILTAKYTFKTGTSIGKGAGFLASHSINYLMHIGLLNLFIYMGIPATVAPIPVYCIAIPTNFILVRSVFKH